MGLVRKLSKFPVWILSFLGIIIFIITIAVQRLPVHIEKGIQGQKAIQLLDEIRRPILAIKNAEYMDKATTEEKYQSFKKSEASARQLIQHYLKAAAYNPELLQAVIHLDTALQAWLSLEENDWNIHMQKNLASSDKLATNTQQRHHQSTRQFFQVLDILGHGETPVHRDIEQGRMANTILLISGSLLIVYLFTLIIFFQKKRNKELHHYREELEQEVKERTHNLEIKNKELEAFSYSVSHDLRSPLRSIDGFSLALLEDCQKQLDDTGKDYLQRIRKASQRMGSLIDDILHLSRVSKSEINKQPLNLSKMAENIIQDLQQNNPQRQVDIQIEKDLQCEGDQQLINIVLTNLLSNAWKYSAKKERALIEFGLYDKINKVFFIRDNGDGFDMQYMDKLFTAFQRLHGSEFEGNGIGLATVKRILDRHNGSIRAESKPGEGCCFYFSI